MVADSFQRIFQENMVYSHAVYHRSLRDQRLEAVEDVTSGLFRFLPSFVRWQKPVADGLRTKLLNGSVRPSYDIERTARPMNSVEKIVAAKAWRGEGDALGIASVEPGEQVLCRTGFRGVHEYTAGMVVDLYQQHWGNTEMFRPEKIAAFEDHFVLFPTKLYRVREVHSVSRQCADRRDGGCCEKNGIRLHGLGQSCSGVCHRIVVEEGEPGDIIV